MYKCIVKGSVFIAMCWLVILHHSDSAQPLITQAPNIARVSNEIRSNCSDIISEERDSLIFLEVEPWTADKGDWDQIVKTNLPGSITRNHMSDKCNLNKKNLLFKQPELVMVYPAPIYLKHTAVLVFFIRTVDDMNTNQILPPNNVLYCISNKKTVIETTANVNLKKLSKEEFFDFSSFCSHYVIESEDNAELVYGGIVCFVIVIFLALGFVLGQRVMWNPTCGQFCLKLRSNSPDTQETKKTETASTQVHYEAESHTLSVN